MDSAKWRTYGSVMVALGMSGDGGGVRVGGGLQCWWINFWGSHWTPGLWRHAPSPCLCHIGRCRSCLPWLAGFESLQPCGLGGGDL